MPRPRKTVRLRDIIKWVNRANATSTCDAKVREGWNALVNSLLMEADAYEGFWPLRAIELTGEAAGHPPGIVFDDSGECRHEFPDESRIRFFIPKGL